MESEKVKEIKKALECWQESVMLSTDENYVSHKVYNREILDYINELESENERLSNALEDNVTAYEDGFQDGASLKGRIENKWVKENQQLKDRIAELGKEIEENAFYSKGYAQGIKNTYEVVMPDKLKQFAEMLKEKATWSFIMCGDHKAGAKTVTLHDIDETLKEFL